MNRQTMDRLITLAKTICPLNYSLKCSHVAFLIKKNKIVKIGWNKNKTTPKNRWHPYVKKITGIHAELDVIIKQGLEDLSSYKLVVIRVDKNGNVSNSCPCQGCKSVIDQFNVGEIWHSNSNGELVEME